MTKLKHILYLSSWRLHTINRTRHFGIKPAQFMTSLQSLRNINTSADTSLERIKIKDLSESKVDQRVKVCGWIHRLRTQSKYTFLVLRDGTGFIQCVSSNRQAIDTSGIDAEEVDQKQPLAIESSVEIVGSVVYVPAGKKSPGGIEIQAESIRILGLSPKSKDAFQEKVNQDAGVDTLLKQRHLVLRGEVASSILKVRALALEGFRNYFKDQSVVEVNPPLIVSALAEGGSAVFHLNYYDKKVSLTQSSQLYLETALPSVGDCFTIQQSFRAESSFTRRHLSEFTHVEAEFGFIEYHELLNKIEDMVVNVCDGLMSSPVSRDIVMQLNPDFKIPSKPFKRIEYAEAIQWLNDHKIKPKEEGEREFKIGDDIPEAAERAMTDFFNEPIFLCKFPQETKAFYMKPCDNGLTESVDLLLPGVGEVLGGSMRITDLNYLLERMKHESVNEQDYYWYIDQRRYGTIEHGGFGLGLERFLAWLLNRYSVKEVCMYPRFVNRCEP